MDLMPQEVKSFESGRHGAILANEAKTVLAGVFNENKPGSPWRDLALRRAINKAIDRQALIDEGAEGYGVMMPVFIQPGRYGHDDGLKPYELDREEASRVIGAANIQGEPRPTHIRQLHAD